MRINDFEESRIIDYLKNNFEELLNKNSIKVIDINPDSMILKCEKELVYFNSHDKDSIIYSSNNEFKSKVKREAYNVKECAAILGICENKMRELLYRKENPAPSIKVGRRVVVPKEAFHKWINKEAISKSL